MEMKMKMYIYITLEKHGQKALKKMEMKMKMYILRTHFLIEKGAFKMICARTSGPPGQTTAESPISQSARYTHTQ
jgi:hypothetical protein